MNRLFSESLLGKYPESHSSRLGSLIRLHPDADDGFYKMVKKKMRKKGVLDYGKYTEVEQHDSCDYTWPTSGL